MTKIVSPEEFAAAYLRSAKQRRKEIEKCWLNVPEYTKFCLSADFGLLADVAKTLGLRYYPRGWGIDAILYERDDTDYLGEWRPEQLSVIVEHENYVGGSRGGANKEINKLSLYNSPLKVMITYPYRKTGQDRLKGYADILRRADIFSDFTTHRRHLVIFGVWPDEERTVSWQCYVYRLGEFVPLEVKV